MIFVTVGNAKQQFSRLLDGIEALIRDGAIGADTVCIQRGNNPPRRIPIRLDEQFFSPEEFRSLIAEADVIVCHGGAGSLSHVFKAGKVPVVMPRRSKYGEHVDDQFNLVWQLVDVGRIIAAFEPQDLESAIRTAEGRRQDGASSPPPMVGLVATAIEELSRPRKG